jgi:hypothetical protein
MPDEVTPENLEEAISKLRKEFVEDRVERAARMMESLRNFMMVYTAVLTLVLAVFAVLGIKSWSDIDNNRIRVETAATQAETAAGKASKVVADASSTLESTKQGEEEFKKQVQENKTVLVGFRSSLNELETKHTALKASQDEVEHKVRALTTNVANTSNSLGVFSSSLNVPLITSVYTSMLENQKLISGFGFGASGRLFIRVTNDNPSITGSFDLKNQSGAVEVPITAISSWSDKVIVCRESEIEKLTGGRTTPLQVQVVTSSDAESNVYSTGVPIPAPIGLTATPTPR